MKKLLTLLAFVLVTFTVDAQSTQKGDVNGDGDISVNDVAMIVNYILGIIDSNFIIANADANGDGEIDINDVMGAVSTIIGDDGGIGNTTQADLTCPDDHHPHAIDLGLPSGTKWACCNVGATVPEGYGGYYAWGETREKSVYNDETYIYATGVDEDGDGWYDDVTFQNLGDDIAGTQYDVAHVKWGGSWVMPSEDQSRELFYDCTYTWTKMNGVIGILFKSDINGGTIFMPKAGCHQDGITLDDDFFDGTGGYYWLSTPRMSYPSVAFSLSFDWQEADLDLEYSIGTGLSSRTDGLSVRPVWVP